MALASIQVEQFSAGRWTGSVEVGGMVARRKEVRASSFDEMLAELSAAYRGMVPAPKIPFMPPPPVQEVAVQALPAGTTAEAASARQPPPVHRQSREELIERARLAGVDVDGRWSDARLLYQTTLAEEARSK